MVVEILIFRGKKCMCPLDPPAAKDHDGAALLHTELGGNRMKFSVESLPSVDRIYGDPDHPVTEIDVKAELVYAKVVEQVREPSHVTHFLSDN